MAAGRQIGNGAAEIRLAPPPDTGEAVGLDAANLTLTVGSARRCSTTGSALRPADRLLSLDLPTFPGDTLSPSQCGGDLAVQTCSDDAQVAVHAVRNLTRIAAGRAAIR